MNNKVYSKIYRKKTLNRISKKCKLLGVNNKLNPIKFMNYRVLLTVLIFVLFLLFNSKGYIYAPILALVTNFGAEYYLD